MVILGPNGPNTITSYEKLCREGCQLSRKVSTADMYFVEHTTQEQASVCHALEWNAPHMKGDP